MRSSGRCPRPRPGAGAIDGTGNGLNNVISGTSAANRLDGGGGADKMAGGGGNDTYVVDDAGDYVKERSGGGTDTVEASANYHITDHVENLILTGAVATRAVGNSLDNAITGNGIGNVLDGRGGADVIDGGGGDDSLYGREGNDTLTGGSGADKFVFDSALGAGNVDSITDFATGVDRIQLDDDIFTAFVGPGSLDPAAFRAGTSAQDGDDRIIYDSSTGNIYYDADGLGGAAQTLFAQLVPGTARASGDLIIGG